MAGKFIACHFLRFIWRKSVFNYKYNYDQIKNAYPYIQMHDRNPEVLAGAMGNEFYIAKFETMDDLLKFKEMVEAKNE